MTDDSRIDSILGDWRVRRDAGEDVSPDAVIAANPDLADSLRARFDAMAALTALRQPSLRSVPPCRYADFRVLGQGGMGIVYWALDTDLNRQVAFKVVRPDAGRSGGPVPSGPIELSPPEADTPASQAFATLKARFLQEAWVTAGLEHPGIVPVYEVGQTPEGVPYYTMRFVKGSRTLAAAIEDARGRPIDGRLALLEPFLRVCDAIRYAHAHGVIHRDLKPDNVALGEFGEVVVLDWGLAKMTDRPDAFAETWQHRLQEYRDAADLRTMASALGTPGYMAPEAAVGRTAEVDARSDVYSLGAILFQVLTGRLPTEFRSYGELVTKLLREDAPGAASLDANVPAELSAIAARALARDREQRTPSVDALAADVRAWMAAQAADREVAALREQAKAAFDAASELTGDLRLHQLDRAASACDQVLARRADDAAATALRRETDALRARGVEERERAARDSARRRAAAIGLWAALAVAAGVVGIVVTANSRLSASEETSRVRLRRALVEQSRAERLSGRRARALELVREAAASGATPDLRAEAMLCLGTPGLRAVCELPRFSPAGGARSQGGLATHAFSPDGRFLADTGMGTSGSGGPREMCRIWSLPTGKLLHSEPTAHEGVIHGPCADWNPRGDVFGFRGENGRWRIWEAATGVARDAHPTGGDVRVHGPARFSGDGENVTISVFGAVLAFGGAGTSSLRRMSLDRADVVAFVGRSAVLVELRGPAPAELRELAVWHLETGTLDRGLPPEAGYDVAVAADGSAAVTRVPAAGPGDHPGDLQVWDVASRALLRVLPGTARVTSAWIAPDGSALSFRDPDNPDALRVWDLRRNRLAAALYGVGRAQTKGSLEAVAVAPGGMHVAASCADDTIVWSVGTGMLVGRLPGAEHPVWSPSGRMLAVRGTGFGPIRIVELIDAVPSADVGRPVDHVRFSPDGRRLAANETLWAVVTDAGRPSLRAARQTIAGERVVPTASGDWSVSWPDLPLDRGIFDFRGPSPPLRLRRGTDAREVALAGPGRPSEPMPECDATGTIPDRLGFSIDAAGTRASVVAFPFSYVNGPGWRFSHEPGVRVLEIWDLASGVCLGQAARTPQWAPPVAASLSPDGRQLVWVDAASIHCWDVASGTEEWSAAPTLARVRAKRVDHPGLYLCGIASHDPAPAEAGRPGFTALSFGADGKPLVASADGFVVRPHGRGVHRDGDCFHLGTLEDGASVRVLAQSPDHRLTAFALSDGSLRLVESRADAPWRYTTPSGEERYVNQLRPEVVRWNPHDGMVLSLAFSPDSALLATGGADGRVRLWPVARLREQCAELGVAW